ncbi:MAG: ATP-binding protein [Cyclobacteriaceae bacterium]
MNLQNNGSENIRLAGFRLQYLEVRNWGTFHDKVWRIQPDGSNSLLTGDIGSGKSTLVDALTCLIVPHHRITFNKAAGAESKERSIRSYVRGEYKKEKNESTNVVRDIPLRADANSYTVILANFFNEDYEENVCLAQLFWMKDDKAEKLFIISSIPLTIADQFTGFSDIQELRKRLRKDAHIQLFDDNFSKYSESSRRLFGMTSDKAIDLFYQTVSMKSVSSLTEFVREHMLDKTDIKTQIEVLKKRFDDLNNAHQSVVTAREQLDILRPLVEYSTTYTDLSKRIQEIDTIVRLIPAWFAEKKIGFLAHEINECELQLSQVQDQLASLEKIIRQLREKEMQLRQDIFNSGGKRLEEIEKEVQQHTTLKDQKLSRSEEYATLAVKCGMRSVDDEQAFYKNIRKANDILVMNSQRQKEIVDERDELKSHERNIKSQIEAEEIELASLRSRKTQIPEAMISIRQQLAEDLGVNESDTPFVGELLKVNGEELEWEGAIEKLLHNFGLSMIVPPNLYNRISNYVNHTVLQSKDGRRQRLVYFKAENNSQRKNINIKSDSVIQKIEIKPDTLHEDWLQHELNHRFNYSCVSLEDFQRLPDAVTREGQIKAGWQRHEKDDRRNIDDRRNYVLGWSNLEKIRAMEASLNNLYNEFKSAQNKIREIEGESNNCKLVEKALLELLRVKNYSEINWKQENITMEQLKQEKRELESSNDILRSLQNQLEQVRKEIGTEELKQKEKNERIGELKKNIQDSGERITECSVLVEGVQDQDRRQFFEMIQALIKDRKLTVRNIDAEQFTLIQKLSGDKGERQKLSEKQNGFRDKIISKMKDIKEHSKVETSELFSSMEALPEYLKMFERVANDDLPRHEKRFKDELNKNTIQSIAIFHSKLESYEKDILDKIHEINKHLKEIEYNPGTYVKILTDRAQDKQIDYFKEDLRNCYAHSFGNNDALYTEEKYNQVKKILDRFNSGQSTDLDWTARVTDVRQWFEFNASEQYMADHTPKEFIPGSSGKSGGQKEKLAYTILASALAFQFGLTFGDTKSRSFRFVVIDEAFGRGSDESTRYGLELFKKLNLQLLIVTPLQKINVIENYVNAVHFVSNKEGKNSQIRNLTYEEYIEEKIKRRLQAVILSPP